jgi:hypothetical protein
MSDPPVVHLSKFLLSFNPASSFYPSIQHYGMKKRPSKLANPLDRGFAGLLIPDYDASGFCGTEVRPIIRRNRLFGNFSLFQYNSLYGQEKDSATSSLAYMNMILHN